MIPLPSPLAPLAGLLADMVEWMESTLFSWAFLVQLAVVVVLWGLATLASRPLIPRMAAFTQFPRIPWAALSGLLMPVIWAFFTLIARTIAYEAGYPRAVLSAALGLLFTWVLAQLIVVFSPRSLWVKALAVLIWVMVALGILGLYEPVVSALDAAGIELGRSRLSLLSLLKGAVVFGLLLWGAGALSRLAETGLRQSHDLTPSLQELLVKMVKVVLLVLAFFVGLSSLGIDLGALALFSGALGVGLGFGLQKILANFISGIILLMDRSIKPGDVIAVENTYGWVNRLGARYVSVITRDGKEHLIPNELLITEKVENWSYSDTRVRLHAPFTVAYRHDPEMVQKLVLESIQGLPRLLAEPKPLCLLTGFGPNGLNFQLRFWIADPVNGITNVTSTVYMRIWKAFGEHGITVPYPQQEVHLGPGVDPAMAASAP